MDLKSRDSPLRKKYKSLVAQNNNDLMEQQWMRYESLQQRIEQGEPTIWVQDDLDTMINTAVTTTLGGVINKRTNSILLDQDANVLLIGYPDNESQQIFLQNQLMIPNDRSDIYSLDDITERCSTNIQYYKFNRSDHKFKTEMCKNWEEIGKCNYGRKCQFAHGRDEIMTNPTMYENFKYKSKMCKSYHNLQYLSLRKILILSNHDQICPYGTRCLFIHEFNTTEDYRGLNYYQIALNNYDLRAPPPIMRQIIKTFTYFQKNN